jgi:hypothetical protein
VKLSKQSHRKQEVVAKRMKDLPSAREARDKATRPLIFYTLFWLPPPKSRHFFGSYFLTVGSDDGLGMISPLFKMIAIALFYCISKHLPPNMECGGDQVIGV